MKLSPMKDILEMAEERNIAYGAYVTAVSYTHLDVYKRQFMRFVSHLVPV